VSQKWPLTGAGYNRYSHTSKAVKRFCVSKSPYSHNADNNHSKWREDCLEANPP